MKSNSLEPSAFTPNRRAIEREIRTLVEYLQVRQRQKWLEREYSVLVKPKPPSHWFYLWVRQLFLPLAQATRHSVIGKVINAVQRWLRHTLVKG